MECLKDLQERDGTSLGLTKPRVVEQFLIEKDADRWKPKWEAQMQQLNLFGPERKPLRKLPFKFSYQFRCHDERCNGHKMMIADWEVYELFWNVLDRSRDADETIAKVRTKFFDEMCGPKKDTHFFVGTVNRYRSWIVLGVFWPPKPVPREIQTELPLAL